MTLSVACVIITIIIVINIIMKSDTECAASGQHQHQERCYQVTRGEIINGDKRAKNENNLCPRHDPVIVTDELGEISGQNVHSFILMFGQ